jgi:propanol-preferring alcohol dehydrogenase
LACCFGCDAELCSMSGSTVPGTFQHYIVSFTRYLTPIPEGLDMAEAAPVLCE